MLILGWVLAGLAFLAFEAALLTFGATGSGQYLSIIGALKYDLMPASSSIPFSQWPWGDVSVGSVLSGSIKGLF